MKQNNNHRTEEEYYIESKRLRAEVMQIAESLKGNPMRFVITNEITMRVEITKTDLKTIVSKNVGDDKFNAIKNALAKDIRGYLEKAQYLGWRPVAEGKHAESAYTLENNYSVLTSRLPIQTGLLPYDALYFCCKDRK